jgi:hypothetical protein
MVACELFVPCGLTMDLFAFFSYSFSYFSHALRTLTLTLTRTRYSFLPALC